MLPKSSSGAQASSRGRMAAWNPSHQGCASTSPFGLRLCIGWNRCGAVERTLRVMSHDGVDRRNLRSCFLSGVAAAAKDAR
jgi:hypothetical protein